MGLSRKTRSEILDYILNKKHLFQDIFVCIIFMDMFEHMSAMKSLDTTASSDWLDMSKYISSYPIHFGSKRPYNTIMSDMLYDRLKILDCSDELFITFVECCLHPIITPSSRVSNEMQKRFNVALARDGYQLELSRWQEGKPIYTMVNLKRMLEGEKEKEKKEPGQKALKIFFCYAHEDEFLLDKTKAHLRSLEREGLVDSWNDRDIHAGTKWKTEIDKHLNTSQIILLMISPDFMNSDYCYEIEMKRALERHQSGETCVIPIILRPCLWHNAPFGEFQALPTDGKAVISSHWHNEDEALYDVVNGIRKAIEKLPQ